MHRIELHLAAAEEVEEAHAWYQREASEELAGAFLEEVGLLANPGLIPGPS